MTSPPAPSPTREGAGGEVRGRRMDQEYGGILIVPTIVRLVEAAKRLGLSTAYAAPLAVVIGLVISVGYTVAPGLPGGTLLADATLRGVALGLSSAGLYSTVRQGLAGGSARVTAEGKQG